MTSRNFFLFPVLLLAVACAPAQEGADPAGWNGTITRAGDVTTVVNESGSVWGGDATLVEEASIGVDAGDDAYMFGRIDGIGATEERIYVLDDQLPAVRVYDHSGTHLFDFGGAGAGPGEFNNPVVMAVDPEGRVMVQDLTRINVFDLDGNSIETWPYPGGLILPPVVASDGTAFFPHSWGEDGEWHRGLVGIGQDGAEARLIPFPVYDSARWWIDLRRPNGSLINQYPVPYAPHMNWAVLPSGAVAEGFSEQYRFEVTHPGGRKLVIERVAERVPVSRAEADWRRASVLARMRLHRADATWDANPVPEQKPAFEDLYGDSYGRIWVHRIYATEAVAECDPDYAAALESGNAPRSCWKNLTAFDVFDADTGRYLGSTEPALPEFRRTPAFVRDAVLFAVEDEAGTIMVKRYRLVLPGEEGR